MAVWGSRESFAAQRGLREVHSGGEGLASSLEGNEGTALMAGAELSITPKRCKMMAVGTHTPGSQGLLSRA